MRIRLGGGPEGLRPWIISYFDPNTGYEGHYEVEAASETQARSLFEREIGYGMDITMVLDTSGSNTPRT